VNPWERRQTIIIPEVAVLGKGPDRAADGAQDCKIDAMAEPALNTTANFRDRMMSLIFSVLRKQTNGVSGPSRTEKANKGVTGSRMTAKDLAARPAGFSGKTKRAAEAIVALRARSST
jgi:hypothetical protein